MVSPSPPCSQRCWVIDDLGEVDLVRRKFARIDFRDIAIERIQARVTPSVLHVPWVTLKFLLATLLFGRRKMTEARWNNVLAPILLPFVSLPVGPMAYYIVSGTRP
jgi:MPBQ/MSBQ methyltransferase